MTRETGETVFVTRDALTEGITEWHLCAIAKEIAWVRPLGSMVGSTNLVACEWHRTRPEAVTAASAVRDAEIARLEARVAELRAMEF